MEEKNYRVFWIDTLSKIAEPILLNIYNDNLKKNMSVECKNDKRIKFAYLEAVGRTICAIAPWLELGVDETEEGKLREKFINYAINGIVNICNPNCEDYLIFDGYDQPLVDAAFLAQGILRAKSQIWDKINDKGKHLILNALLKTRSIKPHNNNWLLFASMIEAFFLETTGNCDKDRLMCGVNKFFNEWYVGDGHYSDGEHYRFDYYNSFVIHPMLTEILLILKKHGMYDEKRVRYQLNRLKHYSSHLERLISPEGTYPIFGRSMVYRTGVFHALGLSCLLGLYDEEIKPEQVCAALTEVIKRQLCDESNFNDGGWLKLGFNGHQISLAENYINTGSLYLCLTVFLPLGLPKTNRFWSYPPEKWTSIKGWDGQDINLSKPL